MRVLEHRRASEQGEGGGGPNVLQTGGKGMAEETTPMKKSPDGCRRSDIRSQFISGGEPDGGLIPDNSGGWYHIPTIIVSFGNEEGGVVGRAA